ncbi:hypothetical protein [Anaerobiospirillum succiniciproducens]|uniref:hypothetical protein n=1 Tax=Anaerobiospirillum succiniciproducens TaxID=13335 RepID=UPI003F8C821D
MKLVVQLRVQKYFYTSEHKQTTLPTRAMPARGMSYDAVPARSMSYDAEQQQLDKA